MVSEVTAALLTVKVDSADWPWKLALTMAVPLQYIVFAVEIPFFVPKDDTQVLSALNWVGLAVTVIGLAAYHAAKDPDEDADADSDDEEAGGLRDLRVGSMSPTVSPFGARGTPTPGGMSPAAARRRLQQRSMEVAPDYGGTRDRASSR